jgi:leucyl-tRNA synthetase
MPVQVNGKLRGTVHIERGAEQVAVEQLARVVINNWLEGKEVVKVVFVKDRLISFVVR